MLQVDKHKRWNHLQLGGSIHCFSCCCTTWCLDNGNRGIGTHIFASGRLTPGLKDVEQLRPDVIHLVHMHAVRMSVWDLGVERTFLQRLDQVRRSNHIHTTLIWQVTTEKNFHMGSNNGVLSTLCSIKALIEPLLSNRKGDVVHTEYVKR